MCVVERFLNSFYLLYENVCFSRRFSTFVFLIYLYLTIQPLMRKRLKTVVFLRVALLYTTTPLMR